MASGQWMAHGAGRQLTKPTPTPRNWVLTSLNATSNRPCPPAVDCLAASEHSMRSMTAAGEAFCAALRQRYPGSRMAASSVGRLPAEAEEASVHSAHRHNS